MAQDRHDSGHGGRVGTTSENPYVTVNYLFAAWLQTHEAGGHRIKKVDRIKPGKAKFFFDLSDDQVADLKLRWVSSSCAEFERIRKSTIDLAFR